MNKKKLIFSVLIAVVLVITLIITLVIQQKSKNKAASNQVVKKETQAEIQTISKELSSSLQVSSGLAEKVEVHATYYFSELLVEKNVYVTEGTNLLRYTNGTYLVAPYDLVITNYSLPESGEMCTNSHYIEVQTTETLASSIEINESDMRVHYTW